MTDALDTLQGDLEAALMDCLDGTARGTMLYKRMRRVLEARLQTRLGHGEFQGVRAVRIEIGPTEVEGGVYVAVTLERGPRVKVIRFTSGQM